MSRHLLNDVTFIIPYYMDSKERYENLCAVYEFISQKFTTNIIVVRYAGSGSKTPVYNKKDKVNNLHIPGWNGEFHRTKAINEGIEMARTKYISIYDTDCIFLTSSILEAVDMLREGASLVYPYGGKFVDIKRSYIKEGVIEELHSYTVNSYGGACFLNREDYISCGMENENLAGAWCHDDVERYERVNKLGYKVRRVLDGVCYHIQHPVSDASKSNPSDTEYMKIKNMRKSELQEYIKTWPWLQR